MREWKLRDTVMVIFMVLVVGIMLLQMVQNDRLHDQVSRSIRTMDDGTASLDQFNRRVARMVRLLDNQVAGSRPADGGPTTSRPAGLFSQFLEEELLVPGAEPGGTVTVCYSAQPTSINPLTYKDYYAGIIMDEGGLYATLLRRDPETLEFAGDLAESWSVSEDKLELTYKIKPEAVWSDGHLVTAKDVAFSFRALMVPQVDAQRIQTYYIDVEKVEALDERAVRFTMKKPYFKSLEISGEMAIIPEHVINPDGLLDSDQKAFARRINEWNAFWDDKPPVTCGPFVLESWDKSSNRVVLRRNTLYWGPMPPLQRLVFRFIPNDVARLQALKAEELDAMWLTTEQWRNETNDPEFLDRFEKRKYLKVTAGFNYIGYNQRHKPFDEKKVRYALSHCVPRELIREKIFYNLRELANGPFGLGSLQSSPNVGQWPYDPEKAKRLLTEAGFKDTDGDGILDRDGESFEYSLDIPAGAIQYEQICALIQDELSKIGVKMNIDPYEWSVFEERLSQRKHDACLLAWGGVVENDAYQIWHSSSMKGRGSNHIGFSNPEIDRLIEEARVEFDLEKRNKMYHRIHEIIFEEQPYTFLFTGPSLLAHHKRVRNVRTTKIGTDFTEWWIPKDQRRTAE